MQNFFGIVWSVVGEYHVVFVRVLCGVLCEAVCCTHANLFRASQNPESGVDFETQFRSLHLTQPRLRSGHAQENPVRGAWWTL